MLKCKYLCTMVFTIRQKVNLYGIIRLTRSYNLLIIFCTQYLVFLFLLQDGNLSLQKLWHPPFFILSFSTIAIAAAGYIINDYHDVKIDMVNKPHRVVVGNSVNRRIALLLYASFSIAGIILGFLISWQIGIVNIFSAGLLWLYSIKFKKIALWGNLTIALLTALSIAVLYLWWPQNNETSLWAYIWFAFVITLIREIIKDMEDIKGDKMYGCKTLPIIYGLPATARILYFLNAVMSVTLLIAFIYTDNIILKGFSLLVLFQIIYLSYTLRKTDTIYGFRRLGKFCKIIMLTGVVALVFI